MLYVILCITLALSNYCSFGLNFNGKDFFVKGVSYSPVPIDRSPVWDAPFGDYFTQEYEDLWHRDFKGIQEMGANVVRIYGWNTSRDHSAFFDVLDSYGLKAIVTFYLGTAQDFPMKTERQRNHIVDSFSREVEKYTGHPAILGWTFGNEVNNLWANFLNDLNEGFDCKWDPQPTPSGCWDNPGYEGKCVKSIECLYGKLFGLMSNASIAAHAVMTKGKRELIFSSLADVDQMSMRVEKFNHYAAAVDVWGLQIYRGKDFGLDATNILELFPKITEKPYLITEYGVDAYRDPCGTCEADNCSTPCYNTEFDNYEGFGEDQESHAEWNIALTRLLWNYQGKGSNGGCLMSWIDEYWKGGLPGLIKGCNPIIGETDFSEKTCDWKGHADCPTSDIRRHSICGYWIGASFDHYVNEGWFGINSVEKSPDGGPDKLSPRKLYFELQKLWRNSSPI